MCEIDDASSTIKKKSKTKTLEEKSKRLLMRQKKNFNKIKLFTLKYIQI